jgi:hypothetical protein
MAGITTPFTTPVFLFADCPLRTLDNINPALVLATGPTVPVGDADAGLGQGCSASIAASVPVRAAMECFGSA